MSRGGSNGNVLGVSHSEMVQRGFNDNVLGGCPTSGCVQREFSGTVVSRGGPK